MIDIIDSVAGTGAIHDEQDATTWVPGSAKLGYNAFGNSWEDPWVEG